MTWLPRRLAGSLFSWWRAAAALCLALVVSMISACTTSTGSDQARHATPPAFLGALTASTDGTLWFIEPTGIGIMTGRGQVRHVRLDPAPKFYERSAVDPAGGLWFTWGDSIGHLTAAGRVLRIPVGLPQVTLDALTVVPDGTLWFLLTSGRQPAYGTT
jgi:hypothetical protein